MVLAGLRQRLTRWSRGRGFGPGTHVAFLATALVVTALGLGGEGAETALRYEREAILAGEWWRLTTGHLVHLNWGHLLLNAAGLGLVWALFGDLWDAPEWGCLALAGVGAIGAGFLLLETDLEWYVGLSGLLHAFFAAGVIGWLRGGGGREAWLLTGFLVAKLAWEQTMGPLPFTQASAGGPVIVAAHLYGALGGMAGAAALAARRRSKARYTV